MKLEFKLINDNTAYAVESFELTGKNDDVIVIPNTFEGKPVVGISEGAFYSHRSLTDVTIGCNITFIGSGAFEDCFHLTSITIPDGVKSIGSYAFHACTNLANITIGHSVRHIGDYAFLNCSNLTSIMIPNGIMSIGKGAFYHCSNLTSITIPDSVTSIGDRAFYYCTSLTSITLGNGVTSIGDRAFSLCTNLTSITIPNSVTSICSSAFCKCNLVRNGKFKATNANLTCRDYKFTINEFSDKRVAKLCESGYHYCENAFDLLNYYHGEIGKDVRFFEVETEGESDEKHLDDSKRVCERIKLVREVKSYAELLNVEEKKND